jgi:hypothetical protein
MIINGIGAFFMFFQAVSSKTDSDNYTHSILRLLSAVYYPDGLGMAQRQLIVYFENAPINNATEI